MPGQHFDESPVAQIVFDQEAIGLDQPGTGGWLRRRAARLHGLPPDELRELWRRHGADVATPMADQIATHSVEPPLVTGTELRA